MECLEATDRKRNRGVCACVGVLCVFAHERHVYNNIKLDIDNSKQNDKETVYYLQTPAYK